MAILTDRLEIEAAPAMEAMLARIEAMVAAAGSLEELREMMLAGFGDIDESALSAILAQAMIAGHLGGRVMLDGDSNG